MKYINFHKFFLSFQDFHNYLNYFLLFSFLETFVLENFISPFSFLRNIYIIVYKVLETTKKNVIFFMFPLLQNHK